MTPNTGHSGRKKTTLRSLTVAETVMELDGASLSDISNELGLAKSTAHSHLETLRDRGYLVKQGKQYHIGLQYLHLGGYAISRDRSYNIVREKVKGLARTTGERAQYIVHQNGRGVYVFSDRESTSAVQTDVRLGKQAFLHTTAAGKAILANLPKARVDEIIGQHGLKAETDQTITHREELFEVLEAVRDRGFAYNRGERLEKQWAIGAAIVGGDDTVTGAISVSGPKHRMKEKEARDNLPGELMGVVNEIELNLAHT